MKFDSNIGHLPRRAVRKIERNLLKACAHPATHAPYFYNLDWISMIIMGSLFTVVSIFFWQQFVIHPLHARAPEASNSVRLIETQFSAEQR